MSKPVVLLDPGHGGYDPGACYNGLKEKDLNLVLALKVAGRLEGVKTLLTRERDVYVSLADRVALSRRAEPDLFVSLHANAGGGRGFESFIYRGLGVNDPAVAMQAELHRSVMAALNRWAIVDRGPKRAAFYVLKQNPRPAVLIESLFLDNAREAALWREPLFAEVLADGIASGIKVALAAAGKSSTPIPTFPPQGGGSLNESVPEAAAAGAAGEEQTIYTVQVGAFAYLENARQRLAEAQQAGFSDAYIYRKQL